MHYWQNKKNGDLQSIQRRLNTYAMESDSSSSTRLQYKNRSVQQIYIFWNTYRPHLTNRKKWPSYDLIMLRQKNQLLYNSTSKSIVLYGCLSWQLTITWTTSVSTWKRFLEKNGWIVNKEKGDKRSNQRNNDCEPHDH